MISIITICFNAKKTIARTFDSILEQVFLPAEYIIIDGMSTDGTLDIINQYRLLFIEKGISLKVVSEKDNGLYDAMNKGVKLVSQEWVHFLNSDDFYVNKYVLSSIHQQLINIKEDIVYGRIIKEKNGFQSIQYDIKEKHLKLNMLSGCPISQPATFFRTDLLMHKYSFDTTYKISADYKLYVEMINNKERFKFIPYFITCFDENGISSINKDGLVIEENIRLLKECGHTTVFIQLSKNKKCFKLYSLLIEFISRF